VGNYNIQQVISANADGPRDAASRPFNHIALNEYRIVLYTKVQGAQYAKLASVDDQKLS